MSFAAWHERRQQQWQQNSGPLLRWSGLGENWSEAATNLMYSNPERDRQVEQLEIVEGTIILKTILGISALLCGLLLIVCIFEYVKTTSWKILGNHCFYPVLCCLWYIASSCRWKGSSAASPKNGFADVGAAHWSWEVPGKIPKDIHKKFMQNSSTAPHCIDPPTNRLFDGLIKSHQLPAATTGLLSIFYWLHFFLVESPW